jgi:hypothetical protein
MFGAVSAMVSAGVGIAVPLLLLLFARFIP